MPMNARLLRPIASGVNRDALDWRDRVVANSGSVSTSTFRAVSTFCNEIDRAGIRDRFYRLNLFCGTGLNACLVPLYRGPSRTGTQYGNATDTNVGPFVSGDYAETGASGGLKGDGNKRLDTGFQVAASGSPIVPRGHMSAWIQAATSAGAGRRSLIGVRADAAPTVRLGFDRDNATTVWGGYGLNDSGFGVTGATVSAAPQLVVGQQANAVELWDNASLVSSTAATTPGVLDRNMLVFTVAYNTGTGVLGGTDGRIGAYSAGLDFTSAGVADYYAALNAFMVALGRK
jgi:hypothetical protein